MLYVHTHTYIYRVFSTGGMGGDTPRTGKNLLIPLLEKFIFSRIPPHRVSIPPPPPLTTKQQFSSYNPIKAVFLAVVIALAPFLF